MRIASRPLLAVLIGLLLVAQGCSSDPKEPSGTPARVPGVQSWSEAALVKTLAGGGIATVTDAGDDEPVEQVAEPTGVVLSAWQVRSMAAQLNAGLGYRATDLNELVVKAGQKVPIAIVLAGWLKAARTPAADAARAITGEQDWETQAMRLTYSDAVVTLFVADLARDAATPASSTKPALFRPGVVPATGVCTALQDLLSNTLDTIVDKLTINATSGVGGVLASIWNTVISIAASAAKLTLEALTAPVMKAIRSAAAVLGVLSSVSSLLNPWTVDISGDKEVSHFGIEPQGAPEVVVTTRVTPDVDFTWPADIKDCAGAAGVKLPDPGAVAGSPVEWTFEGDQQIAQLQAKDDKLRDDSTATLRFTTGSESAKDHEKGTENSGIVTVSAMVKRTAVTDLMGLAESLVIGQLPGPVQGIVSGLLGPVRSEARAKLEQLASADGKARFLVVDYHGPAVQDPPPAYTGPPVACPSGTLTKIPDGVWSGPIALDVVGKGGGAAGLATSRGTGKLRLTLKKGAIVGGLWDIGWRSRGQSTQSGTTVRLDVVGTAKGSVKGSATTPSVHGSWTLQGSAKVLAPIQATLPINESGSDVFERLTLVDVGCDRVVATFVPSFNDKQGDGAPSFTGTATWTGSRVG